MGLLIVLSDDPDGIRTRQRGDPDSSSPGASAVSFIYRMTRWLIFKAIGSDIRNQQKARTLWGSSFLLVWSMRERILGIPERSLDR